MWISNHRPDPQCHFRSKMSGSSKFSSKGVEEPGRGARSRQPASLGLPANETDTPAPLTPRCFPSKSVSILFLEGVAKRRQPILFSVFTRVLVPLPGLSKYFKKLWKKLNRSLINPGSSAIRFFLLTNHFRRSSVFNLMKSIFSND